MATRTPGGIGRLRVHDGLLDLEVLDDEGHHLVVQVPVDHAAVHALHHLHGLHADAAPSRLARRPGIDLLVDAVEAVEGSVGALVVSAGPPPRFTLRLRGPCGAREVALDAVDAAALIFSRRVRLEVRADALDWDHELGRLLRHGDRGAP